MGDLAAGNQRVDGLDGTAADRGCASRIRRRYPGVCRAR
jgi:hypothetical protein